MEAYVKTCEEKYKKFMKNSNIPQYKIANKVFDFQKMEVQSYGSFASAKYNVDMGEHCLEIWEDIGTLGAKGVGTIFHELTHIVDNEKYVKNNHCKKIGNLCFSEYHASQVQLMLYLGAENIMTPISFFMSDELNISTETITVKEYVDASYIRVTEIMKKKGFPESIDILSDVIGGIFNYFGNRSVCKMYALDYHEESDDCIIRNFLSEEKFIFLNEMMVGWFDDEKVQYIDEYCLKMICEFLNKYDLLKR